MVEDFRLNLDNTFYRVGDKAISLAFSKNPWHPAQVIGRSNHYCRFNHDFGYLITASGTFSSLPLAVG